MVRRYSIAVVGARKKKDVAADDGDDNNNNNVYIITVIAESAFWTFGWSGPGHEWLLDCNASLCCNRAN
jgi:hypothetical protein